MPTITSKHCKSLLIAISIFACCLISCSRFSNTHIEQTSNATSSESNACGFSLDNSGGSHEQIGHIEKEETTIKITTLNIGHFSNGSAAYPNGIYNDFDSYKKEFDSIKSDIITINENSDFFDSDSTIPCGNLYASYPFYESGALREYDCNSLLSKYSIVSSKEVLFVYGETRYFLDCLIYLCDSYIHVLVTQLDWGDISLRRTQIEELLEAVSEYEYFIICGDMNPASIVHGENYGDPLSQYPKDYALFKDKNYSIANDGDYGCFNTLVKYENQYIYPWDNIIVSSNIDIVSVERENIIISDHFPLTATLKLL